MTRLLFLKYKDRTLSILNLRKLFKVIFLSYFTASVKGQETYFQKRGDFPPAECISISKKSQIISSFEFLFVEFNILSTICLMRAQIIMEAKVCSDAGNIIIRGQVHSLSGFEF